jgi:glycosyltransferase involved in cell wall biosynthesis
MRILLIHQNFPGQFRHVAPIWARRPGWKVMAIGRDTCPGLPGVPEIKLIRYRPHRDGHKDQHPYLRKMEDAVLHGQAVARVLQGLKQLHQHQQETQGQGASAFIPDVILAHPGWGETLYAKDVFPNARLIHLCEWYYHPTGADVNFDPEFPASLDDQLRIRTWNALHLLNLEHCDAAISPTRWQRAQHPAIYHPKIHVAHEGIQTEGLGPDADATFTVPLRPAATPAMWAEPPVVQNQEPGTSSAPAETTPPSVQAEPPLSVRAEPVEAPARVSVQAELVEASTRPSVRVDPSTSSGLKARPCLVEAPTRASVQTEPVEATAAQNDDGSHLTLKPGDPIITFVARNLEPYRGFHQFMRALEIVQREHPTVQTLIVGGDDVSYGKRPAPNASSKNKSGNKESANTTPRPHPNNWREHMLSQCRVDPARTHFLGRIPYEQYKKVLQVSAAHVYLTVPFVLSWSMLEAMASGCLVIASNTPPVREVIEDGVNGLLVDFFNPQDIARQVLHSLQEPRLNTPLRQAARAYVQQRFNLDAGVAAYEHLLRDHNPPARDSRHPHQRVSSEG